MIVLPLSVTDPRRRLTPGRAWFRVGSGPRGLVFNFRWGDGLRQFIEKSKLPFQVLRVSRGRQKTRRFNITVTVLLLLLMIM